VCCSDVFGIGPLSRREVRRLRVLDEEAADGDAMEMDLLDGTCSFLETDGRCGIHAHPHKPRVCSRFPYTLVATPDGGRVSIEHRCLCPNLPGPPLDAASAARDLSVGGRLKANLRITEVAMDGRAVPFGDYVAAEPALLALAAREMAGVEPFPRLSGTSWRSVAEALRGRVGDSREAEALRWGGDTLASRHGVRAGKRWRFWEVERGAAEDVFAAWLQDEVWGLMWVPYASVRSLRRELATRLWIARRLERRVGAAAAVMLVALVGSTATWESVVLRMKR